MTDRTGQVWVGHGDDAVFLVIGPPTRCERIDLDRLFYEQPCVFFEDGSFGKLPEYHDGGWEASGSVMYRAV